MSKISELSTMTQADLSTFYDCLPILDSSAGTVKKIAVNALQGYTNAANPTANIASLCTSMYTISFAAVRVVSGRLCYFTARVHNNSTGIPTTGLTLTDNIFTLPSEYFTSIVGAPTYKTMTEVPPASAWTLPCLIPINITGNLSLVPGATAFTSNTSLIMPGTLNTSGKIKGLVIYGFALLKADVVLPYDS